MWYHSTKVLEVHKMLTFKVNLGQIILTNKYHSEDVMSDLTLDLFDGESLKEKSVYISFQLNALDSESAVDFVSVHVGEQRIDLFHLLEFDYFRIQMPNYFDTAVRKNFETRTFSLTKYSRQDEESVRKNILSRLASNPSGDSLFQQIGFDLTLEDDDTTFVFSPKSIYASSFIFMSLRRLAEHLDNREIEKNPNVSQEKHSEFLISETLSYLTKYLLKEHTCHGMCHASKSWC